MKTLIERPVLAGGSGAAFGWLVHARGATSPYRFPIDELIVAFNAQVGSIAE